MTTIKQVVDNGNCIGCGACAFALPDLASMTLNAAGHWSAAVEDDSLVDDGAGASICPMSGVSANETELAAELYPELATDDQIGRFGRTIAGHVEVGEFRSAGGSGGLTGWLLNELLTSGKVDAVIHVQPTEKCNTDDVLFEYTIATTVSGLRSGAKSRYYPIEMSKVLTAMASSDLRYAVVGLPCFIKAVRVLEKEGKIPQGRVAHTIGLVCGHLKSKYFGEYLAWQKDVRPSALTYIDFRRKLLDRKASSYGFAARRLGSEVDEVHPMSSVNGRDWGEGMMKNPACEFCDDVLAECADIAVGDAWLPDYVDDPLGTNVAVLRSATVHDIILEGERSGQLRLDDVSVAQVVRSQAAGLRHRRRGLQHRLARRGQERQWTPKKRVEPKLESSFSRRRVYDLRQRIAYQSSASFAVARLLNDLSKFEAEMRPLIAAYRTAVRGSVFRRVGRSLANFIRARVLSR